LDQIVGEAYFSEVFLKEEDMHTGMVPQVPPCGNPETDGGLEGLSARTLYTLPRDGMEGVRTHAAVPGTLNMLVGGDVFGRGILKADDTH
jgi:hypothetical protein